MQRNEMGQVTGMETRVNELLWGSQQKYNTAGQLVEKLMPEASKTHAVTIRQGTLQSKG